MPGERDLRRAGEVEVVALDRVDVRAVGREEARAVHRLLADEHRRQHRQEARLRHDVDRVAVERERDKRRVADHEAEARAREPRGALHVEAADLRVLLRVGERGRLAPAADLLRVLVGVAVGRGVVGRVRDHGEQPRRVRLPPRRAPARPAAAPPSRRAAPRAAPASACPSASSCRAARRPAGTSGAPLLVRGEPCVELLGGALARELAAEAVGVVAGCALRRSREGV